MEYREVKRSALVGERIKMLENDFGGGFSVGDEFTVLAVSDDGFVTFIDVDGDKRQRPLRECVVLEPITEVVHNGQTYKTVSRKARVGELIQITEHDYRPETVGAIVTVKYAQPDGHVFYARPSLNAGKGSRPGHYVVLERVDDTPKDADRITTLEETVKSLTERVAALESKRSYVRDVPHVSRWAEETKTHGEPMTAPLTRADVVEQAKKDVAGLFDGESGKSVTHDDCGHCRVRFVVDRKKRTVRALLRMTYMSADSDIDYEGVAQCAPDDCFNVHIGKAIALRRALGLDIPSEYVNAPKPTTPQVGDIFEWRGSSTGILYKVNRVRDSGRYDIQVLSISKDAESNAAVSVGQRFNDWWSLVGSTILDDSHDFGGQER